MFVPLPTKLEASLRESPVVSRVFDGWSELALPNCWMVAGAIGIRPDGQALEAFAPFGFDDLMNLVIRPNKRQITRTIYVDKVARWKPIWPQVRFLDWDDV